MGTSFGRYKVAEEIGRGAMGVVYRAVDPSIGRSVAIKAINRTYLESVGVQPGAYAERFQREAQVAGALNHPHIVKIFDLGTDYLVMEYVEGQTLAALLRARGRLPRPEALRVLGECASALDHAHQAGVVHRDIKPANVMVQPDGSVKVMDFGLARIESSTLTAAGEVLGSAAYMAPEVVLGQPADARSDIFSLAVVAYELLTGVRPFAGPTVSAIIQSVVRTTPRPVRDLDASLLPEVDAVFTRALAKEPAERFAAAGDFAQALTRAAWSQGGEAGAPLSALVAETAAADVGAATIILETASSIRMPEPAADSAGTSTILRVDADELAETAEVAPPPVESDTNATVILTRPVPETPADEPSAATVILKAPPAPPPPPPAAAAPAAEDAVDATVVLKRPGPPIAEPAPAQVTGEPPDATLRVSPALEATAAPAPPTPVEPPADATVRLDALPAIGPRDRTLLTPAPQASRGPVTPPPAPPDTSATVTLMADAVAPKPAASTDAPPPLTAPPTPPLPLPIVKPAAAPATPAPAPAAKAPAPPPVAAPPPKAAAPAASAPAAPAKKGSGLFVFGILAVVVLLFAAAAGGFWWLVRSRQAAPEATPVPVAESTPAPVDAAPVPDATPETAPSEAPAEATPEPSPSAAADAPRPATLLIESEPTGANVTLGRRRRGRTPVTLSVPPGSTSVVVEKEGYLPWRESVRLKAGETRTLRADLAPVATPRPSVAAPTPAPKPAVREGDLVTLGPDVTPPRKISGPSPNIPDRLRRNLSGSVLVTFIVEIDGSTSGARVVEGLNAVVDKAVLDAVAKTRYEPARSHGVRVRVEQRAKFTFVSQ